MCDKINLHNHNDLFKWSYIAHKNANVHSDKTEHPSYEQVLRMYNDKDMEKSPSLIHGFCFFLFFLSFNTEFNNLLLSNIPILVNTLYKNHPCEYIRNVLRQYNGSITNDENSLLTLVYNIYYSLHSNLNVKHKSFEDIYYQYKDLKPCSDCGGGSGMSINEYRDEEY